VPQEVFTLSEAQTLQGRELYATQDVKDEHERILIPATSVCRVIGLDAWTEYDAIIAIQYTVDGALPKVVLANKTCYQKHFLETWCQADEGTPNP
jgi:hypothetical protein